MMRTIIQSVRRLANWKGMLLLLLLVSFAVLLLRSQSRNPSQVVVHGLEKNRQPVSPMPLHAKVVEQVAADSPEQLLDNLLTKKDDIANAVTVTNLPFNLMAGMSYSYGQAIIPNMGRVRRIIEERQKGQPAPLARLRSMLATSCAKGWQQLGESLPKLSGERSKRGISSIAPFPEFDEWSSRKVFANVAVYLLGEFDDFESLPKFVEIWEMKENLPVSRLFMLSVMADLARRHPREKLSAQASQALDAFLAAGGKVIPAPTGTPLAAWNAPVSETDLRITVMGKNAKDLGLDKVRKIEMRRHSPKLQDYEKPWNAKPPTFGLEPEVFTWLNQVKAFVTLAYPAK